jgi:uncharacterized protein
MLEITIAKETFVLLPEKALLRKATDELIIADVHLGKATHFNKAGMPIPASVVEKEIEQLEQLIKKYQVKSVLFLGDLFHSTINSEWAIFIDFLKRYDTLNFILVKGNHDIFDEKHYSHANFKVVNTLAYDDFIFSHEPIAHTKFVICGHIHPAIKMRSSAKQTLTLPCFYKTDKHLILPAFGSLTGLHVLQMEKANQVFVISKDSVNKVN